jgi:hypothetical protein
LRAGGRTKLVDMGLSPTSFDDGLCIRDAGAVLFPIPSSAEKTLLVCR